MKHRTRHVLLVEDNAADVELFKLAVHDIQADMAIHHVPDAIVAFSFLANEGRFTAKPKADIILLDLSLPNIPGIEALRIIKTTAEWQNIPVVVLTSWEDVKQHERCLALGAANVWVKPARWEAYLHLVTIIQACLEEDTGQEACLEKHSA